MGVEGAAGYTDAVVVHIAHQHVSNRESGPLIAAPVKGALGVVTLEEVDVALFNAAAEAEAMLPVGPDELIDVLVIALRHGVCAAVTGIGQPASVDGRAAAKQGRTVCIQDAKVSRDGDIVERRNVAKEVIHMPVAELIYEVWREDARVSHGLTARMHGIVARAKARRQIREEAFLVLNIQPIAVTPEEAVLVRRLPVNAHIKVVHVLRLLRIDKVVAANAAIGIVLRRKGVQVILRHLAHAAAGNDVAGERCAGDRIIDGAHHSGRRCGAARYRRVRNAGGHGAKPAILRAVCNQLGEISGAHQRGRHRLKAFPLRLHQAQALVAPEEEQFVMQEWQWSTERAAKLLTAIGRRGILAVAEGVIRIGVEDLVAIEEEERSVILVGA